MGSVGVPLEAVPPFRLDLTVWALRRRPVNEMDRWDGQTYRRVFHLPGGPTEVAVTQRGSPEEPRLEMDLAPSPTHPQDVVAAAATLTRVLGLTVDLAPFYTLASTDARLGPLAEQFRGLKPPRFPSIFETLITAIACQQVTLAFGLRLLNRLTEAFGAPAPTGHRAFPQPQDLAGVDEEALRELSFSRQKARAILGIAQAAADGSLLLEGMEALDDAAVMERLTALRGIGRWSAEYVLLRGLGRLHVFPGDDVGGRGNLQRWLGLEEPLNYEGVQRMVAPWQPYAGLVYMHLLLWRLDEQGLIEPR
ncbi:MAG: DNA-3-methyladenine glycosylase family protein [Anaerolineae bacterium]